MDGCIVMGFEVMGVMKERKKEKRNVSSFIADVKEVESCRVEQHNGGDIKGFVVGDEERPPKWIKRLCDRTLGRFTRKSLRYCKATAYR